MKRGLTQTKRVFRFNTWDNFLHGLVGVEKPDPDSNFSQFDDSLELARKDEPSGIEMANSSGATAVMHDTMGKSIDLDEEEGGASAIPTISAASVEAEASRSKLDEEENGNTISSDRFDEIGLRNTDSGKDPDAAGDIASAKSE